MDKKKIISFIKLLDDPDPEIFEAIRSKFISLGIDVIPELEKVWEGELNELLQTRVEDIIHTIQFNYTKKELGNWLVEENNNLLKGVYWIAKYQFPDIDYSDINATIEQVKYDVWLELNDNHTALEKVKILNHIIFDVHKFSGNISNYYSPRNSYINQVLELKKGNPISLSIVYLEIAKRLDLPIYGVNLPKNFILCYVDKLAKTKITDDKDESVLFYINAFNRGTVFGRQEIDYYIKQQKLKAQKSFYMPCNNIDIVRRVILNLIVSYEKSGNSDKIIELQELLNILK